MLSFCITLEPPWRSTFLSEAICRFPARCLSFSVSSLMKQRALLTLSEQDGVTASFAHNAGWLTSRGTFLRARGYFAAVIAAVTQASLPAPSWNVRTRRSRCGSGRRIWLPVRLLACRPFSFSGSSACRAMRPPSRYFTSCAPGWHVLTRIGLAANPKITLKPQKPTSAGVLAARGEAYTTWYSWQAPSKSASASSKGAAISAGPVATQDAFASPTGGSRSRSGI